MCKIRCIEYSLRRVISYISLRRYFTAEFSSRWISGRTSETEINHLIVISTSEIVYSTINTISYCCSIVISPVAKSIR